MEFAVFKYRVTAFLLANAVTQLTGCYTECDAGLAPPASSPADSAGVCLLYAPFQYVLLFKPENGHSVDVLGNAKAQILGSCIIFFPNRSNMKISA